MKSSDSCTPLRDPPLVLPHGEMEGRRNTYYPPRELVAAANTALALCRPLLLTGEPGSGKTDFAWAAAHAFGLQEPQVCNVKSVTQARDLLYHFDAVGRFAEAQVQGALAQAGGDREEILDRVRRETDVRRFLSKCPLGIALTEPGFHVVLVDEVDKAPRDLPNDLLQELDHADSGFEVPEIPEKVMATAELPWTRRMKPQDGWIRPFVVVTSNVERQLPDAFLRRCVFYHLGFAASPMEHFLEKVRDCPGDESRKEAAIGLFLELRESRLNLAKKPGVAELQDWLLVLHQFHGDWKIPGSKNVSWSDVRGLETLVKLVEDRDKLGLSKAVR